MSCVPRLIITLLPYSDTIVKLITGTIPYFASMDEFSHHRRRQIANILTLIHSGISITVVSNGASRYYARRYNISER
jgi:hypothetical protein